MLLQVLQNDSLLAVEAMVMGAMRLDLFAAIHQPLPLGKDSTQPRHFIMPFMMDSSAGHLLFLC